jgi:hypothetical protein
MTAARRNREICGGFGGNGEASEENEKAEGARLIVDDVSERNQCALYWRGRDY